MNMSQGELSYNIKIEGLENVITDMPATVTLQSNKMRSFPINIEMDPANLSVSKTNIEFVVTEAATGSEIAREESRFIAPLN